jgi:RHS repeat-associated protein
VEQTYRYDVLGRPVASQQKVGTDSRRFLYTYQPSGLLSMTYPSDRVVSYTYDGAGKPTGVTGYASGMTYRPSGATRSLTLGNTVVEQWGYNSRQQPTSLTAKLGTTELLKLEYEYNPVAANNNGNVTKQIIHAGGALFTIDYPTYDGMNRLMGAAETSSGKGWSQTFSYDRFGNRSKTSDLTGTSVWDPDGFGQANNRITGNGVNFDNAGNLIAMADVSVAYDAENRQASATVGAASSSYVYDAEGRRVKLSSNGAERIFVYDAMGQLAAEYATGESEPSGKQYLTADMLGSTRLITGDQGTVLNRIDYAPFGEEIPASGCGNPQGPDRSPRCDVAGYVDPNSIRLKFTGKERDTETGLDYFGARYFSSAQGRFTSPDVLMGKPEWLVDPQRWNRYAYVRNNPLKYIDPNGEDLVIYYSLGSDVSQADRDWFERNKEAILAAIRAKYEKAGVKNVSTRPASELNDRQIAALDKGSPFGVSRLEFAGKEYPGLGSAPKQGVLGYAHPDGKGIAAVFLDTFPRNAPAGCDWACMAANVGAHEVGHTLGMPHLGFFEELADRWRQRPASLGGTDGSPDLMTGSMGTPTQPLGFKPGTNDRTRKAVEQLNRIGDMTPKR